MTRGCCWTSDFLTKAPRTRKISMLKRHPSSVLPQNFFQSDFCCFFLLKALIPSKYCRCDMVVEKYKTSKFHTWLVVSRDTSISKPDNHESLHSFSRPDFADSG